LGAITYDEGSSTPAGSGWTYAYDGMDRLETATSEVAADSRSFAYDDADNMVWNSGHCAANPNMVYPTLPTPVGTSINLMDSYAPQMLATSSSSYTNSAYPAPNAIDNNVATEAITNNGASEWMKFDLGNSYAVTSLTLQTRGSWMNGAIVSVLDANGATVQAFPAISGLGSGAATRTFTLPSAKQARSITISGNSIYLVVSELDVFGFLPATPVASPHMHAPDTICGASVNYDGNGNTTVYDVDGSGIIQPRSFVYDGENRPVSVTANSITSRFAYGPDGARSLKVAGAKSYSYFGGEELLQDGSLLTLTSTIAADIRREVLLNQSPQQFGTTDFAFKDQKSSTRLTLRMSPASTTQSDYGPFGQPLTSNGSSILNGRGYINQRYDAEANAQLQYLNARYYDPLLGRFLTPDWFDPMMAGVDVNRYAYSGNDPLNGSDASEHKYQDGRNSSYGVGNGVYVQGGPPSGYAYHYENFAGSFDVWKNPDGTQTRIGKSLATDSENSASQKKCVDVIAVDKLGKPINRNFNQNELKNYSTW
jgi:RHS repeat-associated protein